MFKRLLAMTLLLNCMYLCNAQQDSLLREMRRYKVSVKTTNGNFFKGMIVDANNDSIVIGPSWNTFHASEIKTIRFRRKGGPGRAMLTGGSIGLATGVILGIAEGDDPPDQWIFRSTAGEKAVLYGLLLAPVGMGAAVIISSATTKVHKVDGSQAKYLEAIQHLRNNITKRKKARENQSY